MRLVVLASPDSWHYLDLARAAANLNFEIQPFHFAQLCAAVGISNRNDEQATSFLSSADAVIVRTMPAGSLQQIIFRMDAIGQLASRGKRVFNSPKSIEAAIDKYLTLELLSQANVPVPKTYVSQRVEDAMVHFAALGGNVVTKPIFGSMGRGLARFTEQESAAKHFEHCAETGEVIYQQEFIENVGFDIRLLVLGDEVLAMKRSHPNHWITNLSNGGQSERYDASQTEMELAVRAAKAVGAHFAGVDLVYRESDNVPFVLEVNGAPGWKGISETLEMDVAEKMLLEIQACCQT